MYTTVPACVPSPPSSSRSPSGLPTSTGLPGPDVATGDPNPSFAFPSANAPTVSSMGATGSAAAPIAPLPSSIFRSLDPPPFQRRPKKPPEDFFRSFSSGGDVGVGVAAGRAGSPTTSGVGSPTEVVVSALGTPFAPAFKSAPPTRAATGSNGGVVGGGAVAATTGSSSAVGAVSSTGATGCAVATSAVAFSSAPPTKAATGSYAATGCVSPTGSGGVSATAAADAAGSAAASCDLTSATTSSFGVSV